MSGDSGASKSEQPTPKRLRDARKKGQVAVSKEVTSAAVMLTTMGYFMVFFDDMKEDFKELMLLPKDYLLISIDEGVGKLGPALFDQALSIFVPFIIAIVASVFFSIFIQVGWVWAPERLKINWQAISPVTGAKNIFSRRNLFETFKSALKILVYGGVAWYVIYLNVNDIIYLFACGVDCQLKALGEILLHMFYFIAAILIFLAVLDYTIQHSIYIKELMMTKDEVKREHKDIEGNPEIKQKRKEVHREILEGNADRVGASTAIVTNPTHIAIGIMYEREVTPLPIVVIKESDERAQTIKEVAKRMGKPIIEDVPLARGLYENSDLDAYVPDEFLDSVARVLKWAEQLMQQKS